ncbi:hypothetical protein MLD38_009837 [Melastoma candidum]|uniref:Uncharacterized protein n=1 Tax=Melastoma candidum TaxID=119954 RepID=A0ACB9RZ08_9MYRT|nr:hypothetical protein MLD38_009837 [Melastoma candidum]
MRRNVGWFTFSFAFWSSGSNEGSDRHFDAQGSDLLDGLFAREFDTKKCASRFHSSMIRGASPYKPSSYLISRLRDYEKLHKRCGPRTTAYDQAMPQMKSSSSPGSSECKYVVWISYSGLGNRILTVAATFLYALLTDRVLLVDPGNDFPDLFCEPFPETSWLLPEDFPIRKQFDRLNQKSAASYGNMVKNKQTGRLQSHVYIHLAHDYGDHDKLFLCDEDQKRLENVPWLIMRTDNYFVPSLFLMQSFESELNKLFPQKETIFHHLGRYLFHPTNPVWGLIRRYYDAYLAKADQRIGIQVRTFDTGNGPFPYVMDQILSCTQRENLLPKVDSRGSSVADQPEDPKLRAVLMTSLLLGYSEKLRDVYWQNPTFNGDVIAVYQPSHEEFQQTEKKLHNQKAWAEMYLLSLCDVLVTSAWSTFGYVAQGLGGKTPWILYKPENRTMPDPPCRRALSMEPCFHAPPYYDCKAKKGIDTGAVVPHVRHCEDISWGLKVVDRQEEES